MIRLLIASTIGVLIACPATSRSQASPLSIKESDFIVVADLVQVSPAGVGRNRIHGEQPDKDSHKVVKLDLDIVYSLKGAATGRIQIVLPEGIVYKPGFASLSVVPYSAMPGERSIWFLRKRGANGFPNAPSRAQDGQFMSLWIPEEGDLSTTFVFAQWCQWSCAKRYLGTGGSTFEKLCEIGALNLLDDSADTKYWGPSLLWFLNPWSPRLSDEDRAYFAPYSREAEQFRDRRFNQILTSATPEQKLKALGIQVEWGRSDLATKFVDALLKLDYAALGWLFPSKLPCDELIRLLSHRDIKVVETAISSLRVFPLAKEKFTKVAITRFGETRELDIAILDVLSNLWDRKDLSPRDEEGQYKTDLSLEIYMAKKLVGG